MRLSLYRWLVPGPACVLLQTSFGGFYAYGVFSSRLHAPALTYALGFSAAVLSGGLTAAGLALHRRPAPHSPVRALALLAAALLGIAGFLPVFAAPDDPRPLPLAAAAGALGAGYGVLYVVSIHAVQAWFPEAPGTATGVIVAAGGAGTLAHVALNTALANANRGDVPAAMRASACVTALVALAAAAVVSAPPVLHWSPEDDRGVVGVGEETPLSPRKQRVTRSSSRLGGGIKATAGSRLTVREMLSAAPFYFLLLAVTSSVGPGFGVILHGSRMQTVLFGVAPFEADARFFFITLVGVVGRLVVGLVVDAYTAYVARRAALTGAGDPGAAPFKAAKVVNLFLLCLQGAAVVAAWPLIKTGPAAATTFAVALSCIYLAFSGAAVVMSCLCRATFSPENSTLAFSLVGLAMGVGDVSFSSLVARCAERHPVDYATIVVAEHSDDYDLFFVVSLMFTVVGLVACVMLSPADLSRPWQSTGLSASFDGVPPSLYRDIICTEESQDLEETLSEDGFGASLEETAA